MTQSAVLCPGGARHRLSICQSCRFSSRRDHDQQGPAETLSVRAVTPNAKPQTESSDRRQAVNIHNAGCADTVIIIMHRTIMEASWIQSFSTRGQGFGFVIHALAHNRQHCGSDCGKLLESFRSGSGFTTEAKLVGDWSRPVRHPRAIKRQTPMIHEIRSAWAVDTAVPSDLLEKIELVFHPEPEHRSRNQQDEALRQLLVSIITPGAQSQEAPPNRSVHVKAFSLCSVKADAVSSTINTQTRLQADIDEQDPMRPGFRDVSVLAPCHEWPEPLTNDSSSFNHEAPQHCLLRTDQVTSWLQL